MPIANHSYDAEAQAYSVQFKEGGPIYKYQGVDAETAADIQGVEEADVGKTIQAVLVRGKFEFEKVEPQQDSDSEGGDPA